ncbi:hypothetical protein RN001_009068 [Aquatica leii]|uniref:Pentatricopeptide repeat-containing protein 1 n=1 Tax=Aquatica leii TaxID=1421715 RepID=A0AAN7PV02_9COLE|nr:hypothetical protein RN001_009068 [Aquatica leii]
MFSRIIKRLPNRHYTDLRNVLYCICNTTKSNQFNTYRLIHAQAQASSTLTEKEFLVKLRNDPDKFGHQLEDDAKIESSDLEERKFLEEKPMSFQQLSTKQYADIIKSYLRKRKIKEAIDVVEVRMLKEDKVKPENYLYNLLIGACGRVGYTKKAFMLYNEMKRRSLKVTPGTYTALFNACANSPWPTTDGLTRAKGLLDSMKEKMYVPNVTNYNAMIKAFGRCGDLNLAFSLVDEMVARKLLIKDDTLNFLLQACITDKEAGFRHALLVWRKFIEKRITPSVYSYNLMLRCIRECGLGDITITNDVINNLLLAPKTKVPLLEPTTNDMFLGRQLALPEDDLNRPNLMAVIPRLGNILSLSEVVKPEDRLLLVGGCSGFLKNMNENNCSPDIKTFTQLLDNVPTTLAAEADLVKALKQYKLKPDIDFFNMLIKKRCMRFDYKGAKEALEMLKTEGYRPNIITYGVLSLSCKKREEAIELLEGMMQHKYRVNIEILGAMLKQACFHNNFQYVLYLMQTCIREGIDPDKKFMSTLEEFKKKCKVICNEKENSEFKSSSFHKNYKLFKMEYREWCGEVKVQDEDTHPWQQYRQTSETDSRHYVDKESKSRFRPVHNSLFKHKSVVRNITK